MRIASPSLFISDLGRDFRPDALNCRHDSGGATTMAVGEEGGGELTTMAVGEEGGGEVTTMAVGEEGGGEVTTMALGEEGCNGAGLDRGPTKLERLVELFIRELGR
jgi:hypothetical protein